MFNLFEKIFKRKKRETITVDPGSLTQRNLCVSDLYQHELTEYNLNVRDPYQHELTEYNLNVRDPYQHELTRYNPDVRDSRRRKNKYRCE